MPLLLLLNRFFEGGFIVETNKNRLLSLMLCMVLLFTSIGNSIYAYASQGNNNDAPPASGETVENEQLKKATIINSAIIGTWTDSKIKELERSYDSDETTLWNPCASVGYVSGEGIIYTLDERYHLEMLEFTFGRRYYFFDISTSVDGVNYSHQVTINEENYETYYTDDFVCIINNLSVEDTKYIKIEFLGDSDNNCWISLYEVNVFGKLWKANIQDATVIGTWINDRTESASWSPQKAYDGDSSTFWNPNATNGYSSGEGIIFELDATYDVSKLEILFNRKIYFELFVSSDGIQYSSMSTVDCRNQERYYGDDFNCVLDGLDEKRVKYIKLSFTGDAGNSCWVGLYEFSVYGKESVGMIKNATVVGDWANDRTAVIDVSWSPQKTIDNDTTTFWNPCASTGYASDEGIIYELNQVYEVSMLEMIFSNHYYYFDLLVSKDGHTFSQVANVNSTNYETYYTDGYHCKLDELCLENVKYVKISFTGDSDNACWVSLCEIKIFGKVVSQQTINSANILGAWSESRNNPESSWSAQKSYDGDETSFWNPCASEGYSSNEAIVYTLEESCDITRMNLLFGLRYYYFHVSVSVDGETYTRIATVNDDNYMEYYSDGYLCKLNRLELENIKYIKVEFTGDSQNIHWISLYEIKVFGNVVTEQTIEDSSVLGGWTDGRLDPKSPWSAKKSYDGDNTSFWNPCASEGYASNEAIVYKLAETCDITRIQLLFGLRYYYFHVSVSADGENYTRIATVNADNYLEYYTDGYLCTLKNLELDNVKYIRLEFTGDSQNMHWISLFDISVYCSGEQNGKIRNTTSLSAGIDDLGRRLDTVVGNDKSKEVGIFYFLWQGSHGASTIHDVSKIIKNDPLAVLSSTAWLAAGGGDYVEMHWWGEPLFGYYQQNDEWVIDRDVQMLTDAGVDFLAIDCTNGHAYTEKWVILLRILDKYYQQGFNVPHVTPIIKAKPGQTIMTVYEDIYLAYPKYSHLWYQMDGKPLMIADNSAPGLSSECLECFSFLFPQWPREEYHANGIPWMDFGWWTEDGKQAVFGTEGSKTIMCASLAQHSGTLAFSSSAFYGDTTNRTKSWHDGANDSAEDAYLYGYNFAEQFEYAMECNPDIIFITGWNEWIAQRQRNWYDITDPIILVDCADINNSRDIQPMKGGYGDNYYMQMMQYIRQYKGLAPANEGLNTTTSVLPVTIDVTKSLSQWKNINWYYLDYLNDTNNRNSIGFGNVLYTDTTGRNDIHKTKVANDSENLYAYVQTRETIVGIGEEHCLSMFISTGNSANANWCGYDFAVNRVATTNGKMVVEKRGTEGWEKVAEIEYLVNENELHFAVPLATLGLESDNVSIEFKFADNYQGEDDIFSFYLNGDAAPYGRANYVYDNRGVFDIKKFNINPTKAIPNGITQ